MYKQYNPLYLCYMLYDIKCNKDHHKLKINNTANKLVFVKYLRWVPSIFLWFKWFCLYQFKHPTLITLKTFFMQNGLCFFFHMEGYTYTIRNSSLTNEWMCIKICQYSIMTNYFLCLKSITTSTMKIKGDIFLVH